MPSSIPCSPSAFTGGSSPGRDLWTGAPLVAVTLASAEDASGCAALAVRGFETMRRLSSYERRALLGAIVAQLESRRGAFTSLIAREVGKPLALAAGEVGRAIDTFTIAMEEATRNTGAVVSVDVTAASKGYTARTSRVPAGPVLAITPFNFPLNLVAHKVAPALAAGCSVLLKPAPQAPRTALLLAECIREAGAPEGALVVVPCGNEVAETLVRSPAFALLSFTGSDAVGWHLKSIAGKKRVALELGGNAATIVHEDARLDVAADRIAAGAFAYSGQVCIKVQRLYVHERVADGFIAELVTRARDLPAPAPLEKATLMGPLIDERAAARVDSWVREAVDAGADLLTGGGRHGTWYEPTILSIRGAGDGLRVVDDELFGPVLTVHRYSHWDDALAMADASRFGLQAGIFTDSHERIESAWEHLHVGGLIVNDIPSFRVDSMPYGGVRDSGTGREGVRYAMAEMTEEKLLVTRSLAPKAPKAG